MAEITIPITTGMWKDSILTVSPRGNGIEWTLRTPNTSLVAKVYEPTVDVKELYVSVIGDQSYLKKRFMTPWEPSEPLRFSKENALKLYDYLCEHIEWSPSALESGTAHPDLLAAKRRHSTAAGRGGSRRRTRRARRL